MKITWFGHSCFTIESLGYSILIDPFSPTMLPWLPEVHVAVNRVLCSHDHEDHNYTAAATIVSTPAAPIQVTELSTFHDDVKGAERGLNTMFLLEAEGLRVAHLGDLGCMPTEEQLAALHGVDALLIPIGGYYTINAEMAKRIVSLLEPRVVIPMHYKGKGFGFPVLGSVEQFTHRFCSSTIQWHSGHTLELTAETSHQIAVLTCPLV